MKIASTRSVIACCLSLFIVACGGGGGANDRGSDTPNPPPPASTEPQTTVAARVMALPARAMITQVVGADKGSRLGTDGSVQLKVSSQAPLILALSEQNDIVLASTSSATSLELDAQSTAIALVRLMLDQLPENATEQSVAALITGDARFPVLANQIDQAIAAQRVPGRSAQVLETAHLIAKSVSEHRNVVAAALSSSDMDDVESPLPYRFPGQLNNVFVTGGLVNVYNHSLLFWDATSSKANGDALPGARTVLLTPAEPGAIIRSKLPLWTPPAGQPLPNDGERAFRLTVAQSPESRRRSILMLYQSSIKFLVGAVPGAPEACFAELATALLDRDLGDLAAKPDSGLLLEYMRGAGAAAAQALFTARLTAASSTVCLGPEWNLRRAELLRKLVPVAARLNLLANAVAAFETATDAVTLVARAQAITRQWTAAATVRVCVAGGAVANCADKFVFEENGDLIFLEGAQQIIKVAALDVRGNAVLMPASVRFASDGGAGMVDAVTGRFTAGTRPGATVVTVADEATGVSAKRTVFTERGVLSPQELLLSPNGASGAVRLTAQNGGAIVTSGVALSWASQDGAVASLLAGEGASTGLLFPKASGTTAVIVNNPVSGAFLSATVRVASNEFILEAVPRHPDQPATLGCTSFVNNNGNGQYSAELCASSDNALVRCVGAGCTPGRFYVAVASSTLRHSFNCVFPISCQRDTATQENFGIDPALSASFSVDQIGKTWLELGNGGWRSPWNSISPVAPPSLIMRNIVITDASTAYYGVPYNESVQLDVVMRFYDRQEGKYYDRAVNMHLP